MRSKPVPVEGGQWYLVSVGYRTTGFGEPGKYSGVDSYVSVTWNDAAGKQIGSSPGISFPYHPVDWDLGDRFVLAPAGAAQLVLTVSLNNHSQQQIGKNIPSALWLDGWQVRQYNPPPTPEWALQKVPRIVEGGLSTSRAQAYQLSSQNMAGGKWSSIVADPQATYDSVISSPEGVGRGIMAHSPYFTNAPPGLYRAVLRSKVASNTGDKKPGPWTCSPSSPARGPNSICFPRTFRRRTPIRSSPSTSSCAPPATGAFGSTRRAISRSPRTSSKIFPLALLEDKQLLELYPGSEGAIPADVQPRRNAYPFHRPARRRGPVRLLPHRRRPSPQRIRHEAEDDSHPERPLSGLRRLPRDRQGTVRPQRDLPVRRRPHRADAAPEEHARRVRAARRRADRLRRSQGPGPRRTEGLAPRRQSCP